MSKILEVDRDVAKNEALVAELIKFGVELVRVDSMNEAVALLSKGGEWFFIVINEDSLPDFMEMLGVMRDATDAPIFALTSNYTREKKIKAISNGADIYDLFSENTKDNLIGALELIKKQNRRTSLCSAVEPPVLIAGDIILSLSRHSVFVGDTKVSLTRKAFDILYQLMCNSGRIVTHESLLSKIWGERDVDVAVLWRAVDLLRSKLSEASHIDYIKVERGVGYVFRI